MIKLYNTLTRKKEIFKPLEEKKVKMYVCGPTTYNYIHLGNARPVVVFDTIRRYFEYKGYQVTFIQNFTDIDDKIINQAKKEGIEPLKLSAKYIEEYFKDADALNVKRANVHPKVSEHITDIIEMIKNIINNGFAYELDGDVYFDVKKLSSYGELSGRSLDELKAGARIQIDERKKNPLDFALWKRVEPGEISWDSPWGKGRPGWHIECSVMSLKYLGEQFDIHGGGHDLIFPHHENEMAQSRACNCRFANYWLHNGFITVNQEKMSKSLGNFFLVREILEKFSPDVVRYYLLATHYRSPLDFDDEKLVVASKSLEKLKNLKELLEETITRPVEKGEDNTNNSVKISETIDELTRKFSEAMDDDFNTALAIAALFDFTREINSIINSTEFKLSAQVREELIGAKKIFLQLGGDVLGFFFDVEEANKDKSNEIIDDLIKILIDIRNDARKEKQWPLADKIRDALKEVGIILEDSPQGTKWKLNKN